jgi:glyoxylase-like metal-dependent hydrolase (beta-lactamase superfamily II)
MIRTLLFTSTAMLGLMACSPDEGVLAPETEAATESVVQNVTETATDVVTDSADRPDTIEPPEELNLTVEEINPTLHVLFGPGGNIGVSSGPEGVVLIDDKFGQNAEEILYHIQTITQANGASPELLFVINTHLHGDHTGSNPEMKEAGAMIMGHDNIRKRMGTTYENKAFGRTVEAKDPSFFPVVTFSEEATLHFNDVTAQAIHIPAAHTDGDSIIHFVEPDVIHMGDNLFLGMFPFVDVDSGGSFQGMIAAHDAALALAGEDTVIIPGHGPLTDKAGLQKARDELQTIFDRVRVRKEAGQSLEQILAERPLADMEAMNAFIKEDGIIAMAWRSMGGEL